jgi:hypothetical protein
MNPGPELPRCRCRVCGYDLTSLDWERASYRCPECGAVNIPGDVKVAPLTRRAWPGLTKTTMIVLWPGLVTGLAAGVQAFAAYDGAAVFAIYTGILGAVICLTWPWAAAEILLFGRVPEQGRRRFMPWLPLGAMAANVMLAISVARVMYLLA